MKRVTYHRFARIELFASSAYYGEQSPENGERFMSAVERAIEDQQLSTREVGTQGPTTAPQISGHVLQLHALQDGIVHAEAHGVAPSFTRSIIAFMASTSNRCVMGSFTVSVFWLVVAGRPASESQ